MSGFNALVPFYDALASVVFFGAINRSHKHLTSFVKPNSKILILGGGTGKLLEYLDSTVSVKYVELSTAMTVQAKARNTAAKVDFIEADFLKWESDQEYDYILCPFFLDLFTKDQLGEVLLKVKRLLKPKGKLLVADFDGNSKKLFHQVLLKLMFVFFSMTGAISIKKYNELFSRLDECFNVTGENRTFYGGFISTKSYSVNS